MAVPAANPIWCSMKQFPDYRLYIETVIVRVLRPMLAKPLLYL